MQARIFVIRLSVLLICAGFLTFALASCSAPESVSTSGSDEQMMNSTGSENFVGAKKSITVLNYGEYIDRSVLSQFEKETGIHVNYEEATTPEEAYAKYSGGGVKYDAICTSDYMLERMIQEGQALELDQKDFSYLDQMDEKIMKMSESFDPGNKYTIPYFWGTVGILYDTTKVKKNVDSWKILFDGSYHKNIIMQNSIRDAYMCGLKYLGYSLNTEDENKIRQAQQLLLKQKPDIEAYFLDETKEEMIAGNAAIAVIYSGEAQLAVDYNSNLHYVIPQEGTNVWIDSWMITKQCKNKKNTEKFLDFLCRKDIAEKNFEEIYYATPNKKVYKSLPEEVKENEVIFPDYKVLKKCEVYKSLDSNTIKLYSRLWKELKVS